MYKLDAVRKRNENDWRCNCGQPGCGSCEEDYRTAHYREDIAYLLRTLDAIASTAEYARTSQNDVDGELEHIHTLATRGKEE